MTPSLEGEAAPITGAAFRVEPRSLVTILSEFTFLESPRWHDGRIWVSDVYSHQVLSAAEDGTDVRVEAELPGQPSGLGWLPDGRLLVVSMKDGLLLRRELSGKLVTHADLTGVTVGYLNDMVVAADGRAYVGALGFDLMGGAPMEPGTVSCVAPDGTVTLAAEGLLTPNGMSITDKGVLLVGESFGNRVTAFDLVADGRVDKRREFARFGPPPAMRSVPDFLPLLSVTPDGCCLDAEGALWVADPPRGRVLRILEGGQIVDSIEIQEGIFACALGGLDGRTLFLCTAPDFDELARTTAHEARLIATKVEVPRAGQP